jgi:hypothetical protein
MGVGAWAAALLVAWGAVAQAATAVVVSPDAPVRAEAAATAPVLQTFAAGEHVYVSPEVTAGFRTIQLPDKRVGFISDGDVRLDAPAPAEPVQPIQPLSVVRAPFLVSSYSQLPELMKEDSLLDQRANDLVAGRHQAIAAVAIGGGAAVVAGLIGAIDEQNDCFGSGFTRMCQKHPNFTILGVAGGLFAVGMLVGALLMPHDNLVDVVNAWNQAHPDRPLAIAPSPYAYGSTPTPPPPSPATP